ncbi:MAG: hypothetical protein AAF797_09825 [Planctomycetota bacterium]
MAAIQPVINALVDLDEPYYVGGSFASIIYGEVRATLDADLVVDLRLESISKLIDRLGSDYYTSREMIHWAIKHQRAFNVIHQATGFKIDLFTLKDTAYDAEAFGRRKMIAVTPPPDPVRWYFATPEDTVLHKLLWYRMGEESRQWKDIRGVLLTQWPHLDHGYLRDWAQHLEVTDLFDEALKEIDHLLPPPS